MIKICRIFALACLVSYLSIIQINGQDDLCVPLGVVNISISYDAVVSWEPHPDEQCGISYYLIYVDSDVGTEYVYALARLTLPVEHLPVCDNYVFRIVAISTDHVEGEESSLATKIPLPENHNLTVAMVMVLETEDGDGIILKWSMDDDWVKCADRFRVIVNDEDIDHIQDIYTFNNTITIPNLAPCTSYELGVVAIYNWALEGPVTVVRHSTPEAILPSPKLNEIVLQSTGAFTSWNVEAYSRNKCPVTSAFVTVIDNYNMTVNILDQTDRQPFAVALDNLQANSLYLVNITVTNSAGPSQPVILAFQTLES